jgi:hypothetical protein
MLIVFALVKKFAVLFWKPKYNTVSKQPTAGPYLKQAETVTCVFNVDSPIHVYFFLLPVLLLLLD